MPLICATPGNHLYLCAAGAVKVRCLTKRAYFKFFDAFDWRGHNARSHRAGLRASQTGEVLEIADGIAGHIIRIVSPVYGEGVLIHIASGDITSRGYAGRQPQ